MPIPAGTSPTAAPLTGPLVYDPALSRVRLTVTVPGLAATVTVERSTDQVRWTTVRGGLSITPAAGRVALSDYEFTPNVGNYYRVRGWSSDGREIGPALNSNPYFETDASDWAAFGGVTVVRSATLAHEGAASALVTPDGVSSSGGLIDGSPRAMVTAGREYRLGAWVNPTQAMTLGVGVEWWNATTGGSLILANSSDVATPSGVWTLRTATFTSPAGAVGGAVRARHAGTPPASATWLADQVEMVELDSGPVFAGSIVPAPVGVWLKSLARPFLNREVTVRDFSEVSRPNRGGVFEVVGRSLPVAVTDVRGSRRWTLQVSTDTPQAANELDLLLAGGDILLVHVPQGAGRISAVPGGYVTVGDTREVTPPTFDLQMRVFDLPLVEVAAPGPDVIGSTVTCQTVLNTYATCQAVLDAHDTCVSLMDLVGDPTDVLVP